MTIKEIESLSGMTRANVRFYEAEGLLSPARRANGYRDYSDKDLEILKRIKLLRLLHMPLEEIKALNDGSEKLVDALDTRLAQLRMDAADLEQSQEVCRIMRENGVRYESFDPQPYLDSFDQLPERPVPALAADTIPKVRSPWRRFFARGFDMMLCSTVWSVFLLLVLNINVSNRGAGADVLDGIVGILLMLFIEPALLALVGTTPGKWFLGLRVTDNDDRRLSYGAALSRTWTVFCRGVGLSIPIYNLVRLWKSYKACDAGETLDWEYDSILTLRDEKAWRGFAYVGACALLFGVIILSVGFAEAPRNRGGLTTAEFCENYNRLEDWYGIDSGSHLDSTGKWAEDASDSYTVYLGGNVNAPDFEITEKDGAVSSVRFEIELHGTDDWAPSCQNQMILSVLSYVCAQDDFGLFSGRKKELVELIQSHPFEDYGFTEAGIIVSCHVSYSGYMDTASAGTLWPEEGAETSFTLSFEMRRENGE